MRAHCAALLCAGIVSISPAMAAAPSALLNKTIRTSFSVSVPAKGADGSTLNGARQVTKTIYVSSLGRIFSETARRAGKASQRTEVGPDVTSRAFRFDGSKLIGVLRLGNGASQMVITFDNNFQTCTTQVLTGGESGSRLTWTGLNGVKYSATGPATTSVQGCSISEGNAFAR